MTKARITENDYVLAVPDAEQSMKFFVDVLGFEHYVVDAKGWCFVRRDNCMFMLGTCPDALRVSEIGDHSFVAYIKVDDIDALHSEFLRNGADFEAPEDKPWGMREFVIHTPDGHGIKFGMRTNHA